MFVLKTVISEFGIMKTGSGAELSGSATLLVTNLMVRLAPVRVETREEVESLAVVGHYPTGHFPIRHFITTRV